MESCRDLSFRSRSAVESHVKSVHEKYKPFKCTLCEDTFKYRSQKKVHLENVHNVEKPFKCEYCDNAFISASLLKQHEMSHSGKIQNLIAYEVRL